MQKHAAATALAIALNIMALTPAVSFGPWRFLMARFSGAASQRAWLAALLAARQLGAAQYLW